MTKRSESLTRREMLAMGVTSLLGSVVGACGRSPAAQWLEAGAAPTPSFVPDVELGITARPGEASILPGAPTEVWRYTGAVLSGPASTLEPVPDSYLGPTLRLRRGQKVRIRFSNRLPDPSIMHWHGLDVPAAADGHPRLAIPGGAEYVYEFEVANRAGTYWYHPHPDMQTGPQVNRGLAGLLIVSDDEEEALELPAGANDLTCVLQDRRFDTDNQLVYSTAMMDMQTGFLGDRVLVNGKPRPSWSLATQAYRIRVLNGSNARIYKLAWSDGTPMTVLGTDGGLLARPVSQRYVTLAPAQRADLWLDLSRRAIGTALELRSESFALGDAGLVMGGGGMGGMGGRGMGRGGGMSGGSLPLGAPVSLLGIDVARREASTPRLPERLSTLEAVPVPVPGASVRRVSLSFQRMQWLLDGRVFAMDEVAQDETVVAGSTHIWELTNVGGPMGMQMAHPIHLHGRQFRVLGRTGGDQANTLRDGAMDGGLMDTVLVLPDETVRIQVTFSTHPGLFLYHCHILEHEDMGMMRNFRVVPARRR
jgi:FtsP/CotA-like multicopper oxidase with cupredoxin domain